ncbi:diguanylate cyclase (GGDEF)-like protein [Clostridiales Family XIII bacterium PM5-7]
MRRIFGFIWDHLDSWDEICINNRARLRLNLILFSFVIFLVFLSMSIYSIVTLDVTKAYSTILFGAITLGIFLWQFFHKEYNMVIAWLFGFMSLGMAVYFISSGGYLNTGHIWICILPIVGTLMVPFRATFIYNGALLLVVFLLFRDPFFDLIPAQYNGYMRVVFPISILFLTLCNYVAEYTRQRTQRQLLIMAKKLRDSAFTDPLTGVYNRRALTSHFGDSHEPAHGLSFALMDLDYFKKVNDLYGHEVGDKLLCHVVKLIKGNIPAGAQLYRWGGEEFLLVFKSSDLATLQEVLEQIRKTIEETPLEDVISEDGIPQSLSVTISIGGMVASPQDSIEHGINFADEQMYMAKNAGRNKVMIKAVES